MSLNLNSEELAQLNAVLGDGEIEAASLREDGALTLPELVKEEEAATLMAETIKESGGTVGDVTKGIISMALLAMLTTACHSPFTTPPGRHTDPPPRGSVPATTKIASIPSVDAVLATAPLPTPSTTPKPVPTPTNPPVDPIPTIR